MTKKCLSSLAVLSMAALLLPLSASAQATRTWVSGVGNDANPCSRTAPCKTFAGAIAKTAAGGEISVLDPGGFGAVTITKSITINGDGTLAGILSSLVNGIIVNAAATDRVVIRNVSINGVGNGLNGIRFLQGRELVVENTTINGVTGIGIEVTVPNGTTLNVKNVTITNAATGIKITSTSGSAVATIDNVDLNALTTGIELAANGVAFIRNSSLNRNNTGLLVSAGTGSATVEFSTMSFNGTGVNASASGATVRLNNNGIYGNTTGVALGVGAIVTSTGNNRINGNGGTTAPNGAVTLQ
jgi:hypothetical protein